MALVFAAGCAHTGAPADAERPSVSLEEDPGPLAEAWRLPERIVDGKTGAPLTQAELLERLLEARVVYVAEKHDSPHHHAVQLAVIDALRGRDPSLGVGMEMFKRPFQKWVSDYVEGELTEAEMLRRTEWPSRWGYDFALYRPIMAYAREHRLPVYALNARDEITRGVARGGLDGLDPADRAAVPDLDLGNEAHRAEIRAVFDEHGMGHGAMSFEDFYTAQVIWDETMGHEVARELAAPGAPHRIVVLAGGGHIEKGHGIPSRAARRGAAPYLTIYPVITDGDPEAVERLVEEGVADVLWVMEPSRDDI